MKVVDSTSEESGRRDGNMTRLVSYWTFAFTLTLVVPALAEETSPPSVAEKLFGNRIEPLFVEKCGGCHGENAKEFKGELDMRTRAGLVKGGESGDPALVPGSSDKSSLVVAIEWRDGVEMPPKENDRLTKSQIADVREWIDAGAPWPDDQRRKQFAKEEWRDANVEGVTIKTSSQMRSPLPWIVCWRALTMVSIGGSIGWTSFVMRIQLVLPMIFLAPTLGVIETT